MITYEHSDKRIIFHIDNNMLKYNY